METAALPLRISLALDQVDATVLAVVLAVVWSDGLSLPSPAPQEDHTVRTACLRPQASQDVLGRLV
jgi:hypothetical protein